MNKTFLTLSLILTLQAHAQSDKTCTDVAAFIRNSIPASDGTSVGSTNSSKDQFEKILKSETFPGVQKAFIKRIASMPLDESARTAIISKISKMKFSTDCEQILGTPKLDESLRFPSIYSPTDNIFYLCDAKPGMSEFVVARIIASELSETINLCGINNIIQRPQQRVASRELSEKDYPIKGILACLRSEKTVGAKRIEDKTPPEKTFCDNDQLTRSFTDWMSTEIVTDYISEKYDSDKTKNPLGKSNWRQGMINLYKSESSYGSQGGEFSEYPEFSTRINSLIATNPALRAKIECRGESKPYCDANNLEQMAQIAGETKAATPGTSPTTPTKSQGGVK